MDGCDDTSLIANSKTSHRIWPSLPSAIRLYRATRPAGFDITHTAFLKHTLLDFPAPHPPLFFCLPHFFFPWIGGGVLVHLSLRSLTTREASVPRLPHLYNRRDASDQPSPPGRLSAAPFFP